MAEKPPIQIEIRENDRFRTELAWLDTKFFIPVNFEIFNQNKETDLEKMPPEQRREAEYLAHNLEVLEMVKEYELDHKLKIFKYISYKQMADIYMNGTMRKEQIKKPKKIIISNNKHLNPLQFSYIADSTAEYRKVNLDVAKTQEMCKKS